MRSRSWVDSKRIAAGGDSALRPKTHVRLAGVIMMAELRTRPTTQSVESFIASSCGEGREPDCRLLMEITAGVTGAEPVMWGSSIVGFGSYHYRYASSREGDWFLVGFAPRNRELTIYITAGLEQHEELLARLAGSRPARAVCTSSASRMWTRASSRNSSRSRSRISGHRSAHTDPPGDHRNGQGRHSPGEAAAAREGRSGSQCGRASRSWQLSLSRCW